MFVSSFHCHLARIPGYMHSLAAFPPSRPVPSSSHTPKAVGSNLRAWGTASYYSGSHLHRLQIVQQPLQQIELSRTAHRLKKRLQQKLAVSRFASQRIQSRNQIKQQLRSDFVVFLMPNRSCFYIVQLKNRVHTRRNQRIGERNVHSIVSVHMVPFNRRLRYTQKRFSMFYAERTPSTTHLVLPQSVSPSTHEVSALPP